MLSPRGRTNSKSISCVLKKARGDFISRIAMGAQHRYQAPAVPSGPSIAIKLGAGIAIRDESEAIIRS